ncbi:mitogen-activated protein kinase kinase kinase 4-like [Ursus arctos]|uniref:mitogen-activated protein kinase kinase kinase 4-like n=1 Tax=Ursus arctos TaxID=9644 RepID=UPI001CF8A4C8|nr:mitogen-activated protein kinase kinase kinase 4-like [Ursus arctos]
MGEGRIARLPGRGQSRNSPSSARRALPLAARGRWWPLPPPPPPPPPPRRRGPASRLQDSSCLLQESSCLLQESGCLLQESFLVEVSSSQNVSRGSSEGFPGPFRKALVL